MCKQLNALSQGHALVATLLQTKGARVQSNPAHVAALCQAASRGNVRKLRLLHDYGLRLDVCDYDFRSSFELLARDSMVLHDNALATLSHIAVIRVLLAGARESLLSETQG